MADSTRSDRPRLIADIGGTNARFVVAEEGGRIPGAMRIIRCAEFAGGSAAIATPTQLRDVALVHALDSGRT